jgi:hypothetical protein
MLTITLLLVLIALGCVLAAAAGRLPLWIAVLFVVLVQLIGFVPLR